MDLEGITRYVIEQALKLASQVLSVLLSHLKEWGIQPLLQHVLVFTIDIIDVVERDIEKEFPTDKVIDKLEDLKLALKGRE